MNGWSHLKYTNDKKHTLKRAMRVAGGEVVMKNTTEPGTCVFCGCGFCELEEIGLSMFYSCPDCGLFSLSLFDIAARIIERYSSSKHIIAGYLFEYNGFLPCFLEHKRNEVLRLDYVSIDKIINGPCIPKDTIQQSERFLVNLYKLSKGRIAVDFKVGLETTLNGAQIFTDSVFLCEKGQGKKEELPLSIAYARNSYEITRLFDLLRDLGYLVLERGSYRFTHKGLERAEQIMSSSNIDSKPEAPAPAVAGYTGGNELNNNRGCNVFLFSWGNFTNTINNTVNAKSEGDKQSYVTALVRKILDWLKRRICG